MGRMRMQRRQVQRFSMRKSMIIGTSCLAIFVIYLSFFGTGIFHSLKSFGATSYTTLRAGAWNNTSNVWSTDGTSPCGCFPGNTISDAVAISHQINSNTTLEISTGGSITIKNSGRLNSNREVFVDAGVLENYGFMSLKDLFVAQGATASVYAPLSITSDLVNEGIVELNSSIIVNNGTIQVNSSGVVTGSHPWEITLNNGTIINKGAWDMTDGCVTINNGNFINNPGAAITGSTGYIETKDGNIDNNGMFSTGVDWCASGQGMGLANASNCIGCRQTGVLPISLIDFSGTIHNNIIYLKWITASELNNDYFTLEKSSDGINFSPFAEIKGAGNSNKILYYNYSDESTGLKNLYYRLSQTDFDGTTVILKTVFINAADKSISSSALKISPNPFRESFTVNFESDVEEKINLQLINLKGGVEFTEYINTLRGVNLYLFTRPDHLTAGTYLLRLSNETSFIGQAKVVCL